MKFKELSQLSWYKLFLTTEAIIIVVHPLKLDKTKKPWDYAMAFWNAGFKNN